MAFQRDLWERRAINRNERFHRNQQSGNQMSKGPRSTLPGRLRWVVLATMMMSTLSSTAAQAALKVPSRDAESCGRNGGEEAPPVGRAPCPGVRPGALVVVEGSRCTLNFLFSAQGAKRYIGTAAHCLLGAPIAVDQERVWDRGEGPVARGSDGRRVGEFVYAVLDKAGDSIEDAPDGRDFALIRIDKNIRSKARMCFFGGPTGIDRSQPSGPITVHWYGNGNGLGSLGFLGEEEPVLPARSGVANGMPNPRSVVATGAATFGDSGAGVLNDQAEAIGLIASLGLHSDSRGDAPQAGVIGIVRLAPVVKAAERALRIKLTLQQAPSSG